MNDYCIITDNGKNHSTMHFKSPYHSEESVSIYTFVKDEYILKYFQKNIDKKLHLRSGAICEILFSFMWGHKIYIIRDIISKKLAVLGEGGIRKCSEDKKFFFDTLFRRKT